MRILVNNVPDKREEKKTQTCYWCHSILEITPADIKKGDVNYSQREVDHNVNGFNCPCCHQFSPLI